MDAQAVLILYLCFFLAQLLWETALDLLNMRHVRQAAGGVPPEFAGIVEPETYRKSVSYTLARMRLGLVSTAISSAVLLAVALSGSLGALDAFIGSLNLHPYLHGILFIAAVALFFYAVSLPLELYSTFVIEARHGFNKTTPRTFAFDALKGLLLAVLIGAPLLLALFWFMDATGSLWWVWAFLAMTAFQLVLTLLYPLVIAPLFNTFTPLAEGALRDRIMEMAGRLGFRTSGIFVMDGSRRSRHSNAYFTGIGKVKRIVLFDTLVSSMSGEEALAVLSHEIGHEKMRHVRKALAVSLLLTLACFWIMGLLLPWLPLYQAFGFTRASYHAIIVLLAFCSGPFTFFLTPLSSLWSRRHEYQADRFAVKAMGGPGHVRSLLVKLAKENLSNLAPHPLYSFWHYSHPTVSERMRALEKP